jgi:hypothetical protein
MVVQGGCEQYRTPQPLPIDHLDVVCASISPTAAAAGDTRRAPGAAHSLSRGRVSPGLGPELGALRTCSSRGSCLFPFLTFLSTLDSNDS